jgi:stage II sporulation protein D
MKVGSSRLFSTWFNIAQDSRGGLVFSGRGYGHGVGLCQWGAKSMGARGFTTLQILSQYYPDAQVVRAW